MESQTLEKPTDIDLLRLAKTGDFDAFQQLIRELQPRVYLSMKRSWFILYGFQERWHFSYNR